ncbi:MAG: hypothetical protein U5Q03_17540 [Bacteroidota bacterium]|nr:hypothetical protein [Bacteroidota bacterium]
MLKSGMKRDYELKPSYCTAKLEFERADRIWREEVEDEEEANLAFEIEEKYNQLVFPTISHNWAIFWLILIGIVEYPLNSSVFQIFGASMRETILFSAAICMYFPCWPIF